MPRSQEAWSQRWQCKKCEAEYLAPIRVKEVGCRNKHKWELMAFIEGDDPDPEKPVKSKQRPKASRVTDVDALLSAFE